MEGNCPFCLGPNVVSLGCLGYLTWYRCQDCGGEFYEKLDPEVVPCR